MKLPPAFCVLSSLSLYFYSIYLRMRTISLVKRLRWSFTGNMNPHALIIGDVDNDKENEFVIGNLNGDLAIFKGDCESGLPAYVCRGLGTITCIAIGDVRNKGKNSVVVINAEGHAHIFDIPCLKKQRGDATPQHISVEDYLRAGRRASDTASLQDFRRMINGNGPSLSLHDEARQEKSSKHVPQIHDLGKPQLTLKVPVNVNKILIADIDNDGLNELILARTDRMLHAFQLVISDVITPLEHAYKGVQTPSLTSLSPSTSSTSLTNMPQERKEQAKLRKGMGWSKPKASLLKEPHKEEKMSLLDKNMWVFDGQITSLCTTTHPDRPNEPLLLVAQPGNTFTIIDKDGKRYNRDFTPQSCKHQYQSPFSYENKSRSLVSKDAPLRMGTLLHSPIKEELEEVEVIEDTSLGQSVNYETGHSFERSNYVVKNWPMLDGDNTGVKNEDIPGITGSEIEGGAVATEIVIGKRHFQGNSKDFSSSEVGMLSMDGKFSIYDLATKSTSQRDLFVTHKLFSLATLDVSKPAYRLPETVATNTPLSSNLPLSLNEDTISSTGKPEKRLYTTEIEDEDEQDEEIVMNTTTDDTQSDEDSDYESVPWSEGSENEDVPECDLFVACAWNGVTYLIDWSKRLEDDPSQIKYQLVKFAFEGRVCAFTAGLYAVESGINIPCLFYVDFEDQIFVYYDVRISSGPVTGFIDVIDDDIEEAWERIVGIDAGIKALVDSNANRKELNQLFTSEHEDTIDLGDGWQGIADDDGSSRVTSTHELVQNEIRDSDPLDLAAFIHECLYEFEDMKERMEEEVIRFEHNRTSKPTAADVRRLSDLNITIETPTIDNDVTSDSASLTGELLPLYPKHSIISEESSEGYDDDTRISSWIERSIIGSSIFTKEDDEGLDESSSESS
ncbi:hypothetical protein BDB01DRAFT_778431 [Pilobolus umbonatus]|nr:hypothetical protein BDB01DRAFT_778431 [Pilobolus umbonatus]